MISPILLILNQSNFRCIQADEVHKICVEYDFDEEKIDEYFKCYEIEEKYKNIPAYEWHQTMTREQKVQSRKLKHMEAERKRLRQEKLKRQREEREQRKQELLAKKAEREQRKKEREERKKREERAKEEKEFYAKMMMEAGIEEGGECEWIQREERREEEERWKRRGSGGEREKDVYGGMNEEEYRVYMERAMNEKRYVCVYVSANVHIYVCIVHERSFISICE